MGVRRNCGPQGISALALLITFFILGNNVGCQQTATVTHRRLIEHQAMIDFSGLKPAEQIDALNCHAAVPRIWQEMKQHTNPLYTHQQWKSPSTKTGIGIAYIRMPLPVSKGLLMWLAKREYTKKGNDGRILAEWTDELGRPWFDAANDKYRVRGYVVVSGFQAWVIYFGHKVDFPPDPAELSLAARAAESVLPNLPGARDATPSEPDGDSPAGLRVSSSSSSAD